MGSRGGTHKKTIRVYTNDPDNKVVQLSVIADVKVVLATRPSRINFGRLNKKDLKRTSRYVALSGKDAERCRITSVTSRNKHIQLEASPNGFPGHKDKHIKITLLPGIDVGRFRDVVTVHTDHEKVKQLRVYVYGWIIGNIKTNPSYMSFGRFESGKEHTRELMLEASSADTTFHITGVRSTVQELSVAYETVEKGKRYRITATVPASYSKILLRGKIIIETDDKEQPSIDVRVFGRKNKTVSRKQKTGKPPKNTAQ